MEALRAALPSPQTVAYVLACLTPLTVLCVPLSAVYVPSLWRAALALAIAVPVALTAVLSNLKHSA